MMDPAKYVAFGHALAAQGSTPGPQFSVFVWAAVQNSKVNGTRANTGHTHISSEITEKVSFAYVPFENQ